MSLLEYYANFRKDLISVIGYVKNADNRYRWSWDETSPNSSIKSSLEIIYEKYIKHASSHGLHIIYRHCDCGNDNHYENESDGYVMDNYSGGNILYNDTRFIWNGPIEQGEIISKCPCSENNLPTNHHVSREVIFDVNADRNTCETIESILVDIYRAICNAGDKKPRSGIREYLLRAVLKLNDAILPGSMDEYIKHQLELAGLRQ